ncbi:uncharacterized protein BXZ73DRAFT_46846, partial [Epithele typhae]|uniref:uncharacterized protein n=1 Tax=Epithele typhae TaxID=378194 RepID=UPI0020072FBB
LNPIDLDTVMDASLSTAQSRLIITANSGHNPKTVPLLSKPSTFLGDRCLHLLPYYVSHFLNARNLHQLLDHANVVVLLDVDTPWVDILGSKPCDGARPPLRYRF